MINDTIDQTTMVNPALASYYVPFGIMVKKDGNVLNILDMPDDEEIQTLAEFIGTAKLTDDSTYSMARVSEAFQYYSKQSTSKRDSEVKQLAFDSWLTSLLEEEKGFVYNRYVVNLT